MAHEVKVEIDKIMARNCSWSVGESLANSGLFDNVGLVLNLLLKKTNYYGDSVQKVFVGNTEGFYGEDPDQWGFGVLLDKVVRLHMEKDTTIVIVPINIVRPISGSTIAMSLVSIVTTTNRLIPILHVAGQMLMKSDPTLSGRIYTEFKRTASAMGMSDSPLFIDHLVDIYRGDIQFNDTWMHPLRLLYLHLMFLAFPSSNEKGIQDIAAFINGLVQGVKTKQEISMFKTNVSKFLCHLYAISNRPNLPTLTKAAMLKRCDIPFLQQAQRRLHDSAHQASILVDTSSFSQLRQNLASAQRLVTGSVNAIYNDFRRFDTLVCKGIRDNLTDLDAKVAK